MGPGEPDTNTPWDSPAPPTPPAPLTPPAPPPAVGPRPAAGPPLAAGPPPAPSPQLPAPPPPFASPTAEAYLSLSEQPPPGGITTGGKVVAAMSVLMLGALVFFVIQAVTPKTWDPVLEPYVAFVESERGLTFTEPVDVRWANIAEEIQNDAPPLPTTDEIDPWSEAYRLLGLVDPEPGTSSDEALTETLAENAGAFYEPWTETIVLPEGQSELALSVTIVHELTHALQHQNGMLDFHDDSPDGSVARLAIIEGDAERIALSWFRGQPEADQQAYLEAIGYDPDVEFPDPENNFYETSFIASYEVGLPMVEAIVEAEGVEAVNELLRSKDAGTTERLIDPFNTSDRSSVDAFFGMRLPAGELEPDGDLGALVWFQVLAPAVGTDAAFDALIGYDDDAFAIFEADGRTCARFSLFFDDASEATEFALVLDELHDNRLHSDTNVEVDICDPISDPALQRFGTILPLIVSNEATSFHLRNGESVEVARCAGIAQAKTMPADRSQDEFVGWDAVFETAPQFIADCQ